MLGIVRHLCCAHLLLHTCSWGLVPEQNPGDGNYWEGYIPSCCSQSHGYNWSSSSFFSTCHCKFPHPQLSPWPALGGLPTSVTPEFIPECVRTLDNHTLISLMFLYMPTHSYSGTKKYQEGAQVFLPSWGKSSPPFCWSGSGTPAVKQFSFLSAAPCHKKPKVPLLCLLARKHVCLFWVQDLSLWSQELWG